MEPTHAGETEIAVQWVRTSWTKSSRGGDAAARRNAVPTVFDLPSVGLPCFDQVQLSESDGFLAHHEITPGLPDRRLILLDSGNGHLRVFPRPPGYAAPRRRRRPPAVRLAAGDWLRWRINYRFHSHQGWIYQVHTWNVAYRPGSDQPFSSPPRRDVDELAWMR